MPRGLDESEYYPTLVITGLIRRAELFRIHSKYSKQLAVLVSTRFTTNDWLARV